MSSVPWTGKRIQQMYKAGYTNSNKNNWYIQKYTKVRNKRTEVLLEIEKSKELDINSVQLSHLLWKIAICG